MFINVKIILNNDKINIMQNPLKGMSEFNEIS